MGQCLNVWLLGYKSATRTLSMAPFLAASWNPEDVVKHLVNLQWFRGSGGADFNFSGSMSLEASKIMLVLLAAICF